MTSRRVVIKRSILLRQPWASAVAEGALPVLLRRMSTHVRGWVGVLSAHDVDEMVTTDEILPVGAIVGAVKLHDSVAIAGSPREWLLEHYGEEVAAFYPPHFLPERGGHAWVLSEALAAREPRAWTRPGGITWARTEASVTGEVARRIAAERKGKGGGARSKVKKR